MRFVFAYVYQNKIMEKFYSNIICIMKRWTKKVTFDLVALETPSYIYLGQIKNLSMY